jgi:hypothetical protein
VDLSHTEAVIGGGGVYGVGGMTGKTGIGLERQDRTGQGRAVVVSGVAACALDASKGERTEGDQRLLLLLAKS